MEEKKKLGLGPAFPVEEVDYVKGEIHQVDADGMSKRLYIATAAMQGLIANPERYKYISEKIISGKLTQEEATKKNIKKAFYFADELLKQENE